MVTSRPLEVSDLPMLQTALDQDQYEHLDAKNYTMDNSFSEVYEDKNGPVGVLRCTKTIRMVSVWCDNKNKRRNAAVTIKAVQNVIERAKAAGFLNIIFETDNEELASFCEKLGFRKAGNTLMLTV